jgi:hypothetical protein
VNQPVGQAALELDPFDRRRFGKQTLGRQIEVVRAQIVHGVVLRRTQMKQPRQRTCDAVCLLAVAHARESRAFQTGFASVVFSWGLCPDAGDPCESLAECFQQPGSRFRPSQALHAVSTTALQRVDLTRAGVRSSATASARSSSLILGAASEPT